MKRPNPRADDKSRVKGIKQMTGMSTGEAAVENAKLHRAAQQANTAPDKAPPPGKKLPPDMMPWAPFLPAYKLKHTSKYEQEDHRRYVAIIANYLSADPKFRHQFNTQEVKEMDTVLSHERRLYEDEMLTKVGRKDANRFNFMPPPFLDCFKRIEGEKCSAILGDAKFLQLEDESEDRSEDGSHGSSSGHGEGVKDAPKSSLLRASPEVLNPGEVIEIELPDMEIRCQFPFNVESVCEYLREWRAKMEPIEEDREALEFALKNRVSCMMDASTLRHMMSDKWPYRTEDFAVKLVVQNRSHRGQSRRLLYFSKPILVSPPSSRYVMHQCVKWSIKSQLMKRPGSQLSPTEEHHSEIPAIHSSSEIPLEKGTVKKTALGLDLLESVVARGPPPKTPRRSARNVRDEEAKRFAATLPRPPLCPTSPRVLPTPRKSQKEGDPPFNVAQDWPPKKRYMLVEMGDGQRILVRASNHGVCATEEGAKLAAILVKLDYLPEIGAEKLHREELIWNTLTRVLKGSQENVLFRMCPTNGQCLQLQKLGKNSTSADASEYDQIAKIIDERCARMRGWMEQFGNLEPGQHLITFAKSGRIRVSSSIPVKQVQDDSDSQKAIYTTEIIKKKCFGEVGAVAAVKRFKEIWNGVDPHIPLRWHIVHSSIPGAYPPERKKLPAPKTLTLKRQNEQPVQDEGEPIKRHRVDTDSPPDRSPSPCQSGGAKSTSIAVKEQQPVASPDRSPSSHPSGAAKSRNESPEPQPATRSPGPRSRPSPLMEQPASERDGDDEELYNGWMKHLHGTLDDEFKDCVVQVGKEVVLHAHKHMLARYSPVLRAKFLDKSEPLEQGDGGMVVVKVPDGFSPRSVRAMIDYLYSGRVDKKELTECGTELFQLATGYAIKDLQKFVESHLSSGMSKRNVLGMAQMAQDLSMSDLFKECARFLDDHIVEISASDEYKKIKREGMLIADLLESAAIRRTELKEEFE